MDGMQRFHDRREAGQLLARRLADYKDRDDVVVLALPRGGVPVAYEIARELKAPLDVFVVRKLGVPWQPELAMGAIAGKGTEVLNDDVVTAYNIPPHVIRAVAERERIELQRRLEEYRGNRLQHDFHDRVVILVEDCQSAVNFIGDAELALLGEASHGTHEFYATRANITKQLILQSGFRGVV